MTWSHWAGGHPVAMHAGLAITMPSCGMSSFHRSVVARLPSYRSRDADAVIYMHAKAADPDPFKPPPHSPRLCSLQLALSRTGNLVCKQCGNLALHKKCPRNLDTCCVQRLPQTPIDTC
ncbi:hypothetical protein GUJ93_ZPchr0005g16338 [Zizania palustris]|uniref:Uncharacterized protein n=1 Tax=Zizania palustris TaxID=103762 RepID=A0A8J5SBB5_ZIZPA|nr:hypothetical protein GUJ93_ZPchr0005g16338 [Zizania palustris]